MSWNIVVCIVAWWTENTEYAVDNGYLSRSQSATPYWVDNHRRYSVHLNVYTEGLGFFEIVKGDFELGKFCQCNGCVEGILHWWRLYTVKSTTIRSKFQLFLRQNQLNESRISIRFSAKHLIYAQSRRGSHFVFCQSFELIAALLSPKIYKANIIRMKKINGLSKVFICLIVVLESKPLLTHSILSKNTSVVFFWLR